MDRLVPETLLYTVLIYRDPLALASSYALARISGLLASGKLTLGDRGRLVELYIRFHRRVEGDGTKYGLETDEGTPEGRGLEAYREDTIQGPLEGVDPPVNVECRVERLPARDSDLHPL